MYVQPRKTPMGVATRLFNILGKVRTALLGAVALISCNALGFSIGLSKDILKSTMAARSLGTTTNLLPMVRLEGPAKETATYASDAQAATFMEVMDACPSVGNEAKETIFPLTSKRQSAAVLMAALACQ